MPQVYNRYHDDAPVEAVYIGRGTPWGNMFSTHNHPGVVHIVETREEAVRLYEEYIKTDPQFRKYVKKELKGKDLLCSCKPKACHGDILLEIANEP